MLIRKVEQWMVREGLLETGDCIAVAVSGGPDSVALLHLLNRLSEPWGLKLTVLHVNHQFRVEESRREAEMVRELAERLGLHCEVGVLDVPAHLKKHGGNPQAAARELRYRYLLDEAGKQGADKLALAHHGDDQAETLLMRLLRGTGPEGLAGMPVSRMERGIRLIRPLLGVYKQELLQYCLEQGLPYCEDSSNKALKYTRNRIRLELIPQLQSGYNRQLAASLNRLADLARAESDYLDRESRAWLDRMARLDETFCSLERAPFIGLHVALQRRMIKLILYYLGPGTDAADYTAIELLREAIVQSDRPNLQLDAGSGIRMVREYDRIVWIRGEHAESGNGEHVHPVEGLSGEIRLGPGCGAMLYQVLESGASERRLTRFEAEFDYDRLEQPLAVRTRRPGDSIRPFGLNGAKKVKDMFIDAKIPPSVREKLPLLVDGQERVLWVPGIRRSSLAIPDASTVRRLRLEYAPSADNGESM